MTASTQTTSRDWGLSTANWMIVGGLLAAVTGLIMFFVGQDTYNGEGIAAFGRALGVVGIFAALLGLHARAIRAPRS